MSAFAVWEQHPAIYRRRMLAKWNYQSIDNCELAYGGDSKLKV